MSGKRSRSGQDKPPPRTAKDWLEGRVGAARRTLASLKARIANYRYRDDFMPWDVLLEARKNAEIDLGYALSDLNKGDQT